MSKSKTTLGNLKKFTRWAAWEKSILATVENPTQCQSLILKRQKSIDDDESESDIVRDQFIKEIKSKRMDSQECCLFISIPTVTCWVNLATGLECNNIKVTRYLKRLGIPELTSARGTGGKRGWRWKGSKAKKGEPMIDLEKSKYMPGN